MVAVILGSAYATSDGGEQEPCPFCGSTDTSWRETSSPIRRGVSDMNDIYTDVHRRRHERYLRREAQRRWEAERPKRILGYLITGVQLVIVSIIFYALLFAGALLASM